MIDPRPDSVIIRFLLGTRYVRHFSRRIIRTYQSTLAEGMRFAFFSGEGSAEVEEILRRHIYERLPIQMGDTVVDAGANIGIFTVVASRLVGERGVVAAVEPTPSSFHLLEKNLSLNGCTNVRPMMAALGERESSGSLNIYKVSALNSFLAWNRVGRAVQHAVAVRIKTLDGLVNELGLDKLDLLKIDAEGYELPILRGGTEAIRRFGPRIVGEAHPTISDSASKIAEFLSEMGCQCQIEPGHADTEMFYADLGSP